MKSIDSINRIYNLKIEKMAKSHPEINSDSFFSVMSAEKYELSKQYLFKQVGLRASLSSLEAELNKY